MSQTPSVSPLQTAAANLAIVGMGAMGRMHAAHVAQRSDWRLCAVVDTSPSAEAWAHAAGLPCFGSSEAMLAGLSVGQRPHAAIVATPNAAHAVSALPLLHAGIVTLVEKPLAHSLHSAGHICAAARASGTPLLVGHQRRHSPFIQLAKRCVQEGQLGRVLTATVMANWLKPEPYFSAPGNEWRSSPGGGPVLINMIHDIDLLLHLLGPATHVQAMAGHAARGFAVEDTAAAVLRFSSGALATLTTSDAVASPWCYDLAAGENEAFPQLDVDALFLSGSEGSLAVPRMQLWRYAQEALGVMDAVGGTGGTGSNGQTGKAGSWNEPLPSERLQAAQHNPYQEQLRHLRAVLDGREQPVCSGEDGWATLQAALAVHESAHTGSAVSLL